MYAIYRVNDDKWFVGWKEEVIPVWTDKTQNAHKYDTRSLANADNESLENDFRFSTIVVNLENKQL